MARPVAKAKIYAHAKPTAALRALFVEQVESITWAYKLAPESSNLPAKPDVPEIEVFEIALKLPDVNHAVLRCIDNAIPFPILFVLRFEGHSQPVAAYKRPSDAASGQWVSTSYTRFLWPIMGSRSLGLSPCCSMRNKMASIGSGGLIIKIRCNQSQCGTVIGIGTDRANGVAVWLFHD